MKWSRGHRSPDLIDRRGSGRGVAGAGMIGLLLPLVRSKWGWGGVLIVLGLFFAWSYFGGEASRSLSGGSETAGPGATDERAAFVGFVLDDVQQTWETLKLRGGTPYERAKLVLFDDRTSTACGFGDAATGPFYCPGDEQVYIDLSFYRALSERLGAPGDFAQAYVIAHEIGHHVQHLTGASERVHRASKSAQRGAEGLLVRLELQADCYAGVWAHSTTARDLLEVGDIDEAMRAAAAIGDDRLQKRSRGEVVPESFTHGTSAQRARWFEAGLISGRPDACDTFSAASL